MHAQAKSLVQRIFKEGSDETRRIQSAYQLLFARPASSAEVEFARDYLQKVARKLDGSDATSSVKSWESLARALYLTNEFVYTE